LVQQPIHISLVILPPRAHARITSIPITKTSLLLVCILLTISFWTTHLIAQHTYILDKTTRFERMRAEEGLSTGFTTCIHQDKYGFIWIGSTIGLNLYDGNKVEIFYADQKNQDALYSDVIYNMFEENDGTMWFATSTGVSKYNRADQTFRNYIPDTIDIANPHNLTQKIVQDGDYLWINVRDELFRFNKVTGQFASFGEDALRPLIGNIYNGSGSQPFYFPEKERGERDLSSYIFIDKSLTLWVCSGEITKGFTLSRFNKKNESFIHFQNIPSNPESFSGKQVTSMIESKDGTIWLATWGGGLLQMLDKKKGKFKQFIHSRGEPRSLLDNELLVVFEDLRGNIWTGGEDGFSHLNINTSQFVNFEIPPNSYDQSKSNHIYGINEDQKGELWLNTYNGFYRYNPSTKVLRHHLKNLKNENSLSGNLVLQIMHDQSGQAWILTYDDGVNKLNHFSNSFQKSEMNSFYPSTLSSNIISRILGDSKGNLWFGTYEEGLNKTTLNKNREFTNFEHYLPEPKYPKSINGNRVYSIFEDQEQTIWVGTQNGLNRYNAKNNDFTRFEHDPYDSTTIGRGTVSAIFEDSYGTFWVGTWNGLYILDKKTGIFLHLISDKNNPGAIVSNEIRKIHEDSHGELWFAGDFLEKLNRSDTSFIHYFSDSIIFRDSKKTDIWDVVEDDSANLWMTTYRGGLIKYQRIDRTFTTVTTKDGLPSNTPAAIEVDDKGFIWVSSTQGISRIDTRDYSIHNYDDADGLAGLEFIDNSSYKDEEGWLYFGGREGISFFHPDSLKDNTIIPPVYVTSLTVAGHQKYFDKPLYEMGSVDLQYNENDFSFDFVALDYINPNKNQFAYMLEGYDEDWNYVGNKRTANYTNMSPGDYTFWVKGSNNNGYWNEQGASLALTIFPPFWRTWWAYGAYVFVLIGLLYILRRNELRKIHLHQELELKNVHAENLAELDAEKTKFFANISHEFRTPLTLILGPLDRFIGKIKNEEQKKELNLVIRNARRLQTLINQLLSLSKLESGKMKLKARPENIVKLSRLFLQSFHSLAEDKEVSIEFESDAEEHIVYIDALKFEKVTNNLLSNAFKFTERGGKIKVSIQLAVPIAIGNSPQSSNQTVQTAERIQIKFCDTGIGMRKEKVQHVFDRFYQVDEQQLKTNLGTGIGLALTKELVELHHGTITAESEHGIGSTFTVFFPLGKKHLSENEIIEPNSSPSEMEDDLLRDDYFLVQDEVSKKEIKTEVTYNSELPVLLIVEDNEDMRAYIKSYLTGSYNIIEATNGKEGAEKAIEQIPDLIVSDLMMPFLDGNEMTNQLKSDERTSHIPIILLTAKASIETKLEGLETGADDFLTKPFDANELLIRIKNLIEQRKKLRSLLSKHIGDTTETRIIKESSGKALSKLDEQFLEKAKALIEKHMADPDFSVELLAQKMAMSRVQLHRKLKGITDYSASDLIRDVRINKAAELLKEGDLNVTQISYEVGISSLSNFAKTFKEKYGVTPTEYSKH